MAMSVPLLPACEIQPLQSRTVRSKCKTTVNVPIPPQRLPTYRGYSTISIEKAYKAVISGEMSLRKAAEEYGIPRSTLHNKVKGKVAINVKSGTKKHLTDEEKAKLVEFLAGCASIGYAKSRKEVQAIAQQIVMHRDPQNTVEITKGWWDSFRCRHPEIKLRQAEPLSYARAVATDVQVIEKYFNLLAEILEDNGLTRCPGQVFNCDETGMPLAHKPPKVASLASQKHPYAITASEKAQITVLACASASGYAMPPMVIFDRKHLQVEMTRDEIPGTFYGLSETGWMDAELFEEWFNSHFLVHAPSVRPLLLLLDGHSSHYNPRLLRTAAEKGVILFCLPPHTTHLLQPLDNGAFSSLKNHWQRECQQFYAKHPGKVLNRRNFMSVFHKAWIHGMTISNVMASFRSVGVYPVDKQVVLSQLSHESSSSPSRDITIPYVPFCTPRKSAGGTHTPRSTESLDHITFTSSEIECFQARMSESNDTQYALWKETFYPRANAPPRDGVLEVILKRPTPPAHHKVQSHSTCGRVLTSQQCIQEMAEKEEKKKRIEEEKEEKRREREKKKKEREEENKKKRQEKERKKEERNQ